MAGRTAERERRPAAVAQGLGAGERHLGRSAYRPPGAGRDRHAGIERVVAEQPVDILRQAVGTQAAHRPDQRQGVMTAPLCLPQGPGTLEKRHIAGIVHTQDRLEREGLRRTHLAQTGEADTFEHHVGPARHFEAGLEGAIDQFGVAVMQMMIVTVNRQHASLPGARRCVAAL